MTEFLIIIIIIAILLALGFGLVGLVVGGRQGSDRMFKSLVVRISLSVFLFLLVLFAGFMGWIEPNIVVLDAAAPLQK
ncbi:MAG: DUF2909 family protein [Candidatus Thioglobus sp.]|nr:DUF2909 family protein [Candidatus Thioglobus sp.]